MKPIALSVACLLVLTAGTTLADDDDHGDNPRETALRGIRQIGHLIDVQEKTVDRLQKSADGVAALYLGLDAKATDLRAAVSQCVEYCDANAQANLLAASQAMQDTQVSFNLQYVALQSQIQNENRSYTAVSNIMKTKHDTVKNAISNIR
jgi:hypothetical protein